MERAIQLTEMEPGQHGVVTRFEGASCCEYRLMELGVLPGTPLRLVRRAPLGDPLEVEVRGFHLSLRATEAACIGVFLR